MHQDFYLSFPDEAAAKAVLHTTHAAELEPDGATVREEYSAPNYANIDTIGVIYKPVGEFNEETGQAVEAIPGWHVNVRVMPGEDASALEPYAVTPATPVRVWG